MKKLIAILLIIFGMKALGQIHKTNNQNDVIISGKLSDSMMKFLKTDPFILFYNDYNSQDYGTGEEIPLDPQKNTFTVRIPLKRSVGYFSVGKRLIRSISDNVFLISKGDSIFMDIRDPEDVRFSGKGSEKLAYQHWAGKLLEADNPNWGVGAQWTDMVNYSKRRTSMHLANALDRLTRSQWPDADSIKDLIRLTTTSSLSREYLINIHSFGLLSDTAYFNYLKREVNFLITQQNGFLVSDPFLVENSFMYADYLFELNEAIARIKIRNIRAPFAFVYPNIKAEYSGLLRDKILPYCFLNMLKYDPDAVNYLDEAVGLVKDSASRQIIARAKAAKSICAKAFAFDLPALNGNRLKLDDLKGKIVILDTYYGGCVHCRELAVGMERIAEHFRGRKDIVYISFDGVARNFEAFSKVAKTGLYGLPETIYTWTGGLGEHHPLLLYYQYTSYPNLLVIGKDGRVISADPEKPLDEASENNFITLIEKNL